MGSLAKEKKMKKLLFCFFMAAGLSLNLSYAAGIADLHKSKGVECASCHGNDTKNLQEPTINTCATCHAPKAVAEKTKDYKPTNPHDSPHYHENLECGNCHHGHSQSEDYCLQWHTFNFKVK